MTLPAVFASTIQQTSEWLKELMQEQSLVTEERAYAALRAVLHQLRDRLPVNEAADLGAQLPLLVRGIYYEGWNPAKTPEKVDREGFYQGVWDKLRGHREIEVDRAIPAVFRLLGRHITPGELDDVKSNLPKDLRALFESTAAEQPR